MALFAREIADGTDYPKPPISAHPAFSAIVAVWFAALLGLGSLTLPAVLIERLVGITGIGSALAAANPPLGTTARTLIAVFAAAAGALAGLAIARRVAAAHAAGSALDDEGGVALRRTPVSIREEVGGESLVNGRGLPVTNRRALAIAEDAEPDDFDYSAPLPDAHEEAEAVPDAGSGRFAQCAAAEPAPPEPAPDAMAATAPKARIVSSPGAPDWRTAPIGELGIVQLVERLAVAIERRREQLAASGPVPVSRPADLDVAAPDDAALAMEAFFGRSPNGNAFRNPDLPQPAWPAPSAPLERAAGTDAALRNALASLQRINGAA